ncbi:MAG: aminotransferase class I/II-fold pyridoxal phosphate-dependent enzyme [Sporichthyaceae bacterium]|nr:aminotransferase class I/II-fold pyridoxal phosphate-dependent enzyme [Sporichthyaceae bacterium]
MDPSTFGIGFDRRDRDRVLAMWAGILDSQRWSEGPFVAEFEQLWADWNGLPAVAFSSWAGAALAALDFIGVAGETVLCPSNTYMANVLAVQRAGGRVAFVDCNRTDLCVSFDHFRRRAQELKPKAAWLVHVGGHIAFEVAQIADYCRQHGIWLIEDCAHAHGAHWHGRRAGSWGDIGLYSFYATKTVSTGEGGMLVSDNPDVVGFAARYRNYGKPDYAGGGLNYRMSEFTAALGLVQTQRLEEIVAWKNAHAREHLDPRYPNRVRLPTGMVSGLYKYIVFEPIPVSTGKVYSQPCHRLAGHDIELPNTDWVASNHWCVPLYYRPCTS